MKYIKVNHKITNQEYQETNSTTRKTASRNLNDLVQRGIFEQSGTTGKGTYYKLKGTKGT